MPRFRSAQASHDDWRHVAKRLAEQLRAAPSAASPTVDTSLPPSDRNDTPTLGILYVTDALASHLSDIRDHLAQRWPSVRWVGASTHGVCAAGAEYQDVPAGVAMLCEMPEDDFSLFAGRTRLELLVPQGGVESMLVHADPGTPDLTEKLEDLCSQIGDGTVFGGVVGGARGLAMQLAGDLASGGLSGAAFGPGVGLRTRVTQGCSPLAREHVISACTSHYIQELDGRPALDVLLDDLDVPAAVRTSRDGDEILRALPSRRLARGLLVGFSATESSRSRGFGDYLVRNVVGIDPVNRLLAVAATPRTGERAVFCTRDGEAARADLIRICTELRDEVETEGLRILGAHYVSCVARGAQLFGAPAAEIGIIEHNLDAVPLVGFFANGEIAGDRLYGYTGVLTLFVEPRPDQA